MAAAPTAVILAGGLGTRIRHLLEGRPKPLALAAGRPFLEWIVRFLAAQEVREVIVSAGYRAELIADFCAGLKVPGVRARCVAESSPQGTAGGFLNAIAGDDTSPAWFVCNGDSLICADLRPFFGALDDDTIDAAIAGLERADTGRYGNLQADDAGCLAAFEEKTGNSGLINAGIYLLRRRTAARLPAARPLSFETDVFPALLRSGGKIRLHRLRGAFIDIGTEETLREADSFIQANRGCFP